MATKEKDSDQLTKTAPPKEKELNEEAIKVQIQEKSDYHNKLAAERERLVGDANKVTEAMTLARGEVINLQNLLSKYFGTDAPSDNGAA